jgi:hypothetical protein
LRSIHRTGTVACALRITALVWHEEEVKLAEVLEKEVDERSSWLRVRRSISFSIACISRTSPVKVASLSLACFSTVAWVSINRPSQATRLTTTLNCRESAHP